MASYLAGTNNALSAKAWAKKASVEALRSMFFGKFIGRDKSSGRLKENDAGAMIVLRNELKGKRGDTVTYGLRVQLNGEGQTGDETTEGNEESLDYRNDSISVDYQDHSVRFNNKMGQQRVEDNLRIDSKDALRDWWEETAEWTMMNHLAGNTLYSGRRFRGNNAITAPTHHLLPNGLATEAAVNADPTAGLTLARISLMRRYAIQNRIRPIKTPMGDMHVGIFHEDAIAALRNDTSTGGFIDIQKSVAAGGKIKDNPIFTGADFIHDNVIVYSTERLMKGIDAAGTGYLGNTRRGVLCGAQALCVAYAADSDQNQYTYKEKLHDYDKELGTCMSAIWGMKKTQYSAVDEDDENISGSAVDHGVVVASFYVKPIAAQF